MRARDRRSDERLVNVQRASDWIIEHTEPRATIAVGFYCFNPGVFFEWLREVEVPVPDSAPDRRRYIVWWYRTVSLNNGVGYACMTNQDLDLAARLAQVEPEKVAVPVQDLRFNRLQSFGVGPNAVNLFRFDFTCGTAPCPPKSAGAGERMQVVAATYGENCHAARGNATSFVALACDGKTTCAYAVNVATLGDPASGCVKDFVAEWTCGASPIVNRAKSVLASPANGEAGYGSIVTLTCEGGG